MNNKRVEFLSKFSIYLKYKKMEFSKYGRFSNIYKYDNDKLLKLFNNMRNHELEKFEKMCDFDLHSFANPKELVFIRNNFFGYIMDKKNGLMLDDLSDLISIRDFVSNLDKVEDDLFKLSINNFILFDLHEQNILYNQIANELTILDMDDYWCKICENNFDGKSIFNYIIALAEDKINMKINSLKDFREFTKNKKLF